MYVLNMYRASGTKVLLKRNDFENAGKRIALAGKFPVLSAMVYERQLKFVLEDVLCVQNAKDGRLSHDYLHASVVCC
jgi:hypothetical protein